MQIVVFLFSFNIRDVSEVNFNMLFSQSQPLSFKANNISDSLTVIRISVLESPQRWKVYIGWLIYYSETASKFSKGFLRFFPDRQHPLNSACVVSDWSETKSVLLNSDLHELLGGNLTGMEKVLG